MRRIVATMALAALVAAGGGTAAGLQSVPDRVTIIEDLSWTDRARLVMDHDSLPTALRALGYRPPSGVEIYLAEVVEGVGQPAYLMHDAGPGAFSLGFWPASSVKLVVTVAALAALAEMGFTGDAVVQQVGERPITIASLYSEAIARSSNSASDRLIQIAGLDYVNQQFLVEEGLESMIIGSTLSGRSVEWPPAYELFEHVSGWGHSRFSNPIDAGYRVRHVEVPARVAQHRYRDNDTSLFDLVEVLRRVTLDAELPSGDGFDLASTDLQRINAALCTAGSTAFGAAAVSVLGQAASSCGKAGWSKGRCTDVAFVVDADSGRRFFLAAAGRCGSQMRGVAQATLRAATELGGTPLQPDAGLPIGVAVEIEDGRLLVTVDTEAESVLAWLGASGPVTLRAEGNHFYGDLGEIRTGRHLLILQSSTAGALVGYRSIGFEALAS